MGKPRTAHRTTRTWAAAAAALALTLTGCTGQTPDEPNPAPTTAAGETVEIQVAGDQPVAVEIPGVGLLEGPAGSITGEGTMTVTPVTGDFTGAAVQGASTGMDVHFEDGASLTKPLTVTFTDVDDLQAGAADGLIPVAAHETPDGTWELAPVTVLDDGTWQMQADSFSAQVPALFDPVKWIEPVASFIKGQVLGESQEVTCDSPAPDWGAVANSTLVLHTCAQSKPSADGRERTEYKLKSNRGYWLEVTVPGTPEYVWVQHQPWPMRQKVAQAMGTDPNRTVYLAPGAEMTIGYPRPAETQNLTVIAQSTPATLAHGVIEAVESAFADALLGTLPGSIAVSGAIVKCSELGIDFTDRYFVSNAAGVGELMECLIKDGLGQFASTENAVSTASTLLGLDLYKQADSGKIVDSLVKVGKPIHALGWVVRLLPFVQTGWANAIDSAVTVVTNGGGTTVQLLMDGPPRPKAPQPPPQPDPAPGPEPQPVPEPDPQPEPQPDPQPEPVWTPEPEPDPVWTPEPVPEPEWTPPPPPPPTIGVVVSDVHYGGTWARTDPNDGTWYAQNTPPANGAWWYRNGLGVAVDCARSAAPYRVVWADGRVEQWTWWLHVTDGKWFPAAATNELMTDGNPGVTVC